MTVSSDLEHRISNDIESILMAIEAIEIKLKMKDLKGALKTISLIKEKKNETMKTILDIKTVLRDSKCHTS